MEPKELKTLEQMHTLGSALGIDLMGMIDRENNKAWARRAEKRASYAEKERQRIEEFNKRFNEPNSKNTDNPGARKWNELLKKPITDSRIVEPHIQHVSETPSDEDENTIILKCLDGEMKFARQSYNESELVRDLIDNNPKWIAEHTIREVSDELYELYCK